MPRRRSLALALLALGALVSAGRARADCAAPVTYAATVSGTTVQVCPTYADDCPGDGLLRRDTSSGEVVLISTCAQTPSGACWVDECVPPGRYQYGRKTPFACSPQSCGTYYFTTVTPTASTAGCQRTTAAPVPYAGAVPWSVTELVCTHEAQGSCSTGGAVLGLNGILLIAGLLLWQRRARRARGG